MVCHLRIQVGKSFSTPSLPTRSRIHHTFWGREHDDLLWSQGTHAIGLHFISPVIFIPRWTFVSEPGKENPNYFDGLMLWFVEWLGECAGHCCYCDPPPITHIISYSFRRMRMTFLFVVQAMICFACTNYAFAYLALTGLVGGCGLTRTWLTAGKGNAPSKETANTCTLKYWIIEP